MAKSRRPHGDGPDPRRRPGTGAGTGHVRSVSGAQSAIEHVAQLGRPGAGGGSAPGRPRQSTDTKSATDAARRDAWDNPDEHSTPARDRVATTDPVDIVTGEVFMAQTDVALPGVLPLVLERTYLSSYRLGQAFGHAWASTLDMRLEPEEDGALLLMADGALLAYGEMPTQTAVFPKAGPRLGLVGPARADRRTHRPDRCCHPALVRRGWEPRPGHRSGRSGSDRLLHAGRTAGDGDRSGRWPAVVQLRPAPQPGRDHRCRRRRDPDQLQPGRATDRTDRAGRFDRDLGVRPAGKSDRKHHPVGGGDQVFVRAFQLPDLAHRPGRHAAGVRVRPAAPVDLRDQPARPDLVVRL